MPAFDNWTKNILLEALENPLYEASSTPDPFDVDYSISNAGVGLCGYDEVSPLEATPEQIWYGTHDVMPSGTNMYSQATWSNYKGLVDRTIDSLGLSGADISIGPVKIPTGAAFAGVLYPLKQAIKTQLAQQYLGGVTGSILTGKGILSGFCGYALPLPPGIDPDKFADTIANMVQSQLPNWSENIGQGRFGRFGEEIAKKLPKLAAMGYDPLDWATKMFGADSAARAFGDIATNPRKSALGAGGYLARGTAKGIY